MMIVEELNRRPISRHLLPPAQAVRRSPEDGDWDRCPEALCVHLGAMLIFSAAAFGAGEPKLGLVVLAMAGCAVAYSHWLPGLVDRRPS